MFFVYFATATNAVSIAKTLEQAGVYWVSGGSTPVEVTAWDYPHWVAHIAYDGFAAGSFTADQLIKALPAAGQGKIIALQSRVDDPPDAERWQGLQKILNDNPGVQLVQWDSAQGDLTTAHDAVRAMMASHPDVNGVWAENDDMALGALQALKELALEGEVKVVGCDGKFDMLEAIKDGLAAATVLNDGKYQAELSLAMALAARQRKLDVVSLPHKNRMFEICGVSVDANNADQVIRDYIDATPSYDLTGFFLRWSVALE